VSLSARAHYKFGENTARRLPKYHFRKVIAKSSMWIRRGKMLNLKAGALWANVGQPQVAMHRNCNLF